jgi:cell division inhibitor SepF
MQNKTVVLNLEGIEEPDKRRIIDFVVGAAYAMHGRIKPIANQTFLIIPQNVGFDGDSFVGELQGSGLV